MSAVPELTVGRLVAEPAAQAGEAGSFLIAGSGSIGRRHLDNLRRLGVDACFYRTGRRDPSAPAPHAAEEFDLAVALERRPRAVLVCNPSAHHLDLALAAARAGAHLLVEKPVAHRLEGTDELLREVRKRRLVALVGFQYRFNPALRQVKRWLEDGALGEVVSARVHWGEYLPSWHPGEDWRASYAARGDLGGGAVRTLCHPFDYLRWLLGEVEWVSAEVSHGALALDVEDTAHVTLRFASGALACIWLDYLCWPREHGLEIVGRRGRILWSDADGAAQLRRIDDQRATTFAPTQGFSRNSMFLDEMGHFLDCLDGTAQPLCTLEDGIAALEIAVAALESARAGRRVRARRRAW
jgi:predicted dehydrogenase